MKGLLALVLAVFVFTSIAAIALADDVPASNDPQNSNSSPNLIMNKPISKLVNVLTKRLEPDNKTIEISNPRGDISISIASGNGTRTIEIEKEFENVQSIKTITITPGHAEVEIEVETENRSVKRNITADWAPSIRARIRESIRNMTCEEACPVLNISYNSSLKKAIIISGNLTVLVNNTIEIDNETVYIKTLKNVRKELKVLPEKASETAKLRVNYHLIKAVEIEGGDDVYYAIKGTQLGKLLGLFPMNIDVQTDVDISSGDVKRIHRPWWSFLVF